MALILLRHGESEGTINNLFDGWRDTKISEIGIRHTAQIAKKLMDKGYEPTRIYTSF